MIGHVEEPDVDTDAGEPEVLERVVLGPRFDDDGRAVLACAEVTEVAVVKQTFDGLGVRLFSLQIGHR
jgi:hypothetical protein